MKCSECIAKGLDKCGGENPEPCPHPKNKLQEIRCPNCYRLIYVENMLIDVRYSGGYADKAAICPHCLCDI